MLSKMCKGFKVEDVYDAVHRAKGLRVRPAGPFIVVGSVPKRERGRLRGDADARQRPLPLMNYFVSMAEPIPGTPLAEEVADMQVSENLLFVRDESSFRRPHGSSVAESRAYKLVMGGCCARLPRLRRPKYQQAVPAGGQETRKGHKKVHSGGEEVVLPTSK